MESELTIWRDYKSSLSLENLRLQILARPKCNAGKPTLVGEILLITLLCEDWEAATVCVDCLREMGFSIEDAFDFGAIIEYFDGWAGCSEEPCSIDFVESEEPLNGLKWLLENGADMARRMSSFPIHYAAIYRMNKCLSLLIEHRACVNLIDVCDENLTPLMDAIEQNNLEGVMILVRSGADPKLTNKSGENVFDIAARCGHKEIIHYLNSQFSR